MPVAAAVGVPPRSVMRNDAGKVRSKVGAGFILQGRSCRTNIDCPAGIRQVKMRWLERWLKVDGRTGRTRRDDEAGGGRSVRF
jgi:hypothetical protein